MATNGVAFDKMETAAMQWAFETSNAKSRLEGDARTRGNEDEANAYRESRWEITSAFQYALSGHTHDLLKLYRQSHDYRMSEWNK